MTLGILASGPVSAKHWQDGRGLDRRNHGAKNCYFPPDPWDGVRIAHGPSMPPDPWDGIRIAHGPSMPPDPWDAVRIAHGPSMPPDPWDAVRIAQGPTFPRPTRES
jgi:hypothetical protein